MKKKLMCLLLAFSLSLGLFVTAAPARAESEMKASEDGIAMIKFFEGFSAKPYRDTDGHYTIGYGTWCPSDKVEYYTQNPMSKEEADAMLRTSITAYEDDVNEFIDKHGLTYTQQQFDAVLCMVFNVGTSWLNRGSTLIRALTGEPTENELLYAFSIYSMSGDSRSIGHVRRRLMEANIYLNGIYDGEVPEQFGYVLYDAQGGTVSTYNVQGYNTELTAEVIPTATRAGYFFKGWYLSQTEGEGEPVTLLDATTRNATLYAHWEVDPNYVPPETTLPPETEPFQSVTVTVTGTEVNVRSGPGVGYEATGKAYQGDQILITDVYEGEDYVWGQFDQGWIALKYTDFDMGLLPSDPTEPEEPTESETATEPEESTEPEGPTESETPSEPSDPSEPETVTKTYGTIINTDVQNVRATPNGTIVGKYYRGDRFEILEMDGLWAKTELGWVYTRSNVKVETVTETVEPEEPETPEEPEEPEEPETVTKTYGTIINTDVQNVRTTPNGTIVGKYYRGDRFEILEMDGLWAKTELGWVYTRSNVKVETVTETVEPEEPETPEEPEEPETVTKTYGTIVNTDSQNVRSTPNGTVVGKLYRGDTVEILEQKYVDGKLWGRCELGWICMRSYVKLETVTETVEPEDPSEPETPEEPEEPETVTKTYGTIINTDVQNVRATPNGTIVGKYYRGDRFEILEMNGLWAKTELGWVYTRSKVKVETVTETVETLAVTKTVTATMLNVRAGAGTTYDIVTRLAKGTVVQVLEEAYVGTTLWVRIEQGWVSADYLA